MRSDRERPLGVIQEASIESLRAIPVAKARRVVAHRDANERSSGVRFAPARIGLDGTGEGAKRSVLVPAPRPSPTMSRSASDDLLALIEHVARVLELRRDLLLVR